MLTCPLHNSPPSVGSRLSTVCSRRPSGFCGRVLFQTAFTLAFLPRVKSTVTELSADRFGRRWKLVAPGISLLRLTGIYWNERPSYLWGGTISVLFPPIEEKKSEVPFVRLIMCVLWAAAP